MVVMLGVQAFVINFRIFDPKSWVALWEGGGWGCRGGAGRGGGGDAMPL